MKTIIKATLLIALSIIASNGLAQSRYGDGTPSTMDVNGIFLYGKYTKAQVMAKWGTSIQYRSSESEFGLNETYRYLNNVFRFGEDGIFHSFRLNTSDFVVYKSKDGGFKVGDPVSRLYTIGVIDRPPTLVEGSGENILELPAGDDWFEIGYKNGIIMWISYTASI
jgi:hypothetical protein